MFENKNKQFGYSKIVFFSRETPPSTPRISSAELTKISEKGEKGEKLDVSTMAAQASNVFKSYADRLAALPKAFQLKLKQQIVRYFLNSTGSYDKDAEKGLSKKLEFRTYKYNMLGLASRIINKYAPSKALIAARKKSKESYRSAMDNVKKMMSREKPKFTSKNDAFSTADLTHPSRIQDETLKIGSQSKTMQTAGRAMFKEIHTTKSAVMTWKSASAKEKALDNGLETNGYTAKSINAMLKKINTSDIVTKFRAKQKTIEQHGQLLIEKGKLIKKRLQESRDRELKALEKKQKGTDKGKLKNKEQYEKAQEARAALEKQKSTLQALYIIEEDTLAKNKKEAAIVHTSKKGLTMAKNTLKGALGQIDKALQNPNLSKPAREALKVKRKMLAGKTEDVRIGIYNANSFEKKRQHKYAFDKNRRLQTQAGCLRIDDYLTNTLDPSIQALDDSMRTLEIEQLSHGTEREQIIAKYARYNDAVDRLNKGVAENVLRTNLSNSFMVENLTKEYNSIKKIKDIKALGFWRGTVAGSFEGTAEGIKWLLKDKLVDSALDPFGKWLNSSDIPVLSQVGWVASKGVTIVSALTEFTQEALSAVASVAAHPLDTAKGISMLFRPSTAGKAWSAVIDGMVSGKDWRSGSYLKAITKLAANILLTVTGGGAIKNGFSAGRHTLKATKGLGMLRRTGATMSAFGKGARQSLAQSGHTFASKIRGAGKFMFSKDGFLRTMARKLPQLPKHVVRKISRAEFTKLKNAYNNFIKLVKQTMRRKKINLTDAEKIVITENKQLAGQALSYLQVRKSRKIAQPPKPKRVIRGAEVPKSKPQPSLKSIRTYLTNDLRKSVEAYVAKNPKAKPAEALGAVLKRRPELARKIKKYGINPELSVLQKSAKGRRVEKPSELKHKEHNKPVGKKEGTLAGKKNTPQPEPKPTKSKLDTETLVMPKTKPAPRPGILPDPDAITFFNIIKEKIKGLMKKTDKRTGRKLTQKAAEEIIAKRLPIQFKIYKDVLKKKAADLVTSKPKPASSAPNAAPAKPASKPTNRDTTETAISRKPTKADATETAVSKKTSAPQSPNEKTGIHNPRARRRKAGGNK